MTQDVEPLTWQKRTNIEEHQQFFSKINEIIANLAPTVDEAEQAIAQATQAIADANAAIGTANAASAAADAAAQQAQTAAATVAGYDTRLSQVENKANTNQANIATVSGLVADNTDDITALQGRMTAAESKDTQQDTAIAALQTADTQNVKISRINEYAVGLTGNQSAFGTKRMWTVIYQGGIVSSGSDAGTYTVLADLGVKIGQGVHVGVTAMGRTGGFDGIISIASDENGFTSVTNVGYNVGGTSTTIGVCFDAEGEIYLVARRLRPAGQSFIVDIKGITHGTSISVPQPIESAATLVNIDNYTEAVKI